MASEIQYTNIDQQIQKLYHRDPHCSGISNPTKLTADEAKEKGYRPCKRCALENISLPT